MKRSRKQDAEFFLVILYTPYFRKFIIECTLSWDEHLYNIVDKIWHDMCI